MPDDADEPLDALSVEKESLQHEESSVAPASIEVIPESRTKSPSGRTKKGDWRFHTASASVLLVIVGVFYWVNRNPGGRRAVDTGLPATAPEKNSVPRASVLGSDSADSTNESESNAPPADSGSGIGSELGGKFDIVLGDIAKQRQGSQPKELEPKEPEEQRWQALPGFPDDIASNFQSSSGWEWAKILPKRIEILPAPNVKSGVRISQQGMELQPGESISVQTSLSTKMPKELAVGFMMGKSAVVLKSEPQRVNLTARLAGEKKSRVLLALDQPTAPVRLEVRRLTETERMSLAGSMVRLTVSSGDMRQSTEIALGSIASKMAVTLLVGPPRAKMGRKFWIADLKTLK